MLEGSVLEAHGWGKLADIARPDAFNYTHALHSYDIFTGERLRGNIPPSLHWSRRWEYPFVLGAFMNQITSPMGKHVICIGAAASPLQFLCSYIHGRCTAVEPSRAARERAKGYAFDLARDGLINRWDVIPDEMGALSFEDESVDGVYCVSVFEHVGKWLKIEKGIKEMWRVLKPGGKMCLTWDVCPAGERELTWFKHKLLCNFLGIPMKPLEGGELQSSQTPEGLLMSANNLYAYGTFHSKEG